MNGTWSSTDTWGGFDTGMVTLAPTVRLFRMTSKRWLRSRKAITEGRLHAFTGPVNKQDGSPWLKAGETADDGTLLGMNFYVEGIEGSLP